jgi:hypothetical protein
MTLADANTASTPTSAAGPSKGKVASGGSKGKPADPLTLKWERRKRPATAFAPSIRSGCTMALWPARDTGVLFGGVTDEDRDEETLESVFHNDMSVSHQSNHL